MKITDVVIQNTIKISKQIMNQMLYFKVLCRQNVSIGNRVQKFDLTYIKSGIKM